MAKDIEVYTLEEIIQILQVTRRTLYNWISSGKLRAFKVGNGWRVTRQALEEFTETGTAQPVKLTDIAFVSGSWEEYQRVTAQFEGVPKLRKVYKDHQRGELYIMYKQQRYYQSDFTTQK